MYWSEISFVNYIVCTLNLLFILTSLTFLLFKGSSSFETPQYFFHLPCILKYHVYPGMISVVSPVSFSAFSLSIPILLSLLVPLQPHLCPLSIPIQLILTLLISFNQAKCIVLNFSFSQPPTKSHISLLFVLSISKVSSVNFTVLY